MDAALAEAFLHAQHSCCGLRLAPFTLRHSFVLEAVESPLALGAPSAGIEISDLLFAAALCSCRDEAELSSFLSTRISDDTQDLAKVADLDLSAELKRWADWVHDYVSLPRLLPQQNATHFQMHWLLSLASRLMHSGGFSPERAWWTPVGEARWYALSFAEMDGAEFKLLDGNLAAHLRAMGHNV